MTRVKLVNISDRLLGTERGNLAPGDFIELELSDAELELWEKTPYAEVQHLDRPAGRGNKKPAAPD
jgi:hypothetical protein